MPSDTGFPEPFCKVRNTTLAHPDAKIGELAIIGGDSGLSLTHKRRFTRHKHTISWGSIDPASEDSDCSSTASMGPSRPGRAALLSSMHPDPSTLPDISTARRPPPPRRGISFAIAEDAEDEDNILNMPRDALQIAGGPGRFEDAAVVEQRRQNGHHRLGSVDSDVSTTSTDYAASPSGSGDEAPDVPQEPPRLKRKMSFFKLLRRSTSKSQLRDSDDY
jgi:hypothetical protein